MKRTLITFLTVLGIFVTYILLINFIATSPFDGLLNFDNTSCDISGTMLDMSVRDKVDVTVIRNRWYGDIVENISQDESKNISTLYLFNFIKIPIIIGSFNLILTHSVVLMLLFLTVVLVLLLDLACKIERRYDKK